MRALLFAVVLGLSAPALACQFPDGVCGPGESCRNCCEDCGFCPVVCGDRFCDGDETAATCRADCARPVFPMALEACVFDASRECDDRLVEVTLELSDLFTSLDARRANQRDVTAYFPSQCCVGNTCGGGLVPPHLIVGDPTNAVGGSGKRLAGLLRSCLDQGLDHFSVAIVPCGSRGQATRLVGIGGLLVDSLIIDRGSVWLRGAAYCAACGDGVCADGESCQPDCGGGSPICY